MGEIFSRTQATQLFADIEICQIELGHILVSKNKYNQVFSLTSFSVQEMSVPWGQVKTPVSSAGMTFVP